MRISVSGRLSRSLQVLVLVAIAVPLAANSALAATQTFESGSIGHVHFSDTAGAPGAVCNYDGTAGTQYFSGIKVKGPKVMWPDQVSGVVEHGWVAFRIQIQHWDGATWTSVKQSAPTKLKAYDNKWTTFPSQSLTWSGPDDHKYRAAVTLKWIKNNGSIEGRAIYSIDNHRRTFNNSVGPACTAAHHDF